MCLAVGSAAALSEQALSQRRRSGLRQPAAAAAARRLGPRQARHADGAGASEGSDAGAAGAASRPIPSNRSIAWRATSSGRASPRSAFRSRAPSSTRCRTDSARRASSPIKQAYKRSRRSRPMPTSSRRPTSRPRAEPDQSERTQHVGAKACVPARDDGAGLKNADEIAKVPGVLRSSLPAAISAISPATSRAIRTTSGRSTSSMTPRSRPARSVRTVGVEGPPGLHLLPAGERDCCHRARREGRAGPACRHPASRRSDLSLLARQ